MAWQDFILTAGSIIFIVALFPSVLGKDKPAIKTSLLTGGVLVVYLVVYISLQLWFTTVTTVVLSPLWFLLAFQQFKRKN